jgi:hypothetical protein
MASRYLAGIPRGKSDTIESAPQQQKRWQQIAPGKRGAESDAVEATVSGHAVMRGGKVSQNRDPKQPE